MEKRKNLKERLAQGVILLVFAFMALGSSSLENMSSEDAYNVGYGAGTLLRNAVK